MFLIYNLLRVYWYKDEFDEASRLIKQFKIVYPEENVDLQDEFPNHFVVNFKEFGHDFNVKFEKKHSARDLSEGTGDIYVIDSNSGQPVKYNLDNVEVYNSSFYVIMTSH